MSPVRLVVSVLITAVVSSKVLGLYLSMEPSNVNPEIIKLYAQNAWSWKVSFVQGDCKNSPISDQYFNCSGQGHQQDSQTSRIPFFL